VLGFPYIFRGALDVRATKINEPMKMAAVRALAELAHEDVPDAVIRAYGGSPIRFGPDYIVPKPFDSRVFLKVVPAVARAAIDSGVSRHHPSTGVTYVRQLEKLLGPEREVMSKLASSAQQKPKRIVLPEGHHPVILRAAHFVAKEGIAYPLPLGKAGEIHALAEPRHRRRNARRHGLGRRQAVADVPVHPPGRIRQRTDLPRSGVGKHRV
jgi:malate dehydrogenase (oxaloacetate-decarboxylating)(NADP+)